MTLDILLFHDNPHWISTALEVELPDVMDEIGLSRREYTIRPLPEALLVDDSAQLLSRVPQGTIVLVHGNHHGGYLTVGHVRRHSFARLDIKFILSCDSAAQERDFFNRDDYAFVREHLLHDPHPVYPVSVTQSRFNLSEFIANRPQGSSPSLGAYLRDYLKLRDLAVPLVIASDRVDGLGPTMRYMPLFMQELGVGSYTLERIAESELGQWDDKLLLPEHTVVVVHGGCIGRYRTIGYVQELVQRRPDIRCLVAVDTSSSPTDFETEALYHFTRQHMEHPMSPEHQVSIVPAPIFDLVSIVPPRSGAGKVFENYLRAYIKQRLVQQPLTTLP